MNKEINTVKDLLANEELLQYIIEDIEDLPEDTEVTYEVWAIGYDSDDTMTDKEVLIGTFTDPDKAVNCAEQLVLADIKSTADVSYWSIEVETVINDDENDYTMNVGTVYQRELWVKTYDVQLTEKDYTLLDDGTLKVSCELLKDFNKNDYVKIKFVEENDNVSILTYKIISKAIYEDMDYFLCEFIY
jgi:hypothetical protein